MTLKTMGRAAVASVMSLAMGLGLTACGGDYTVGYVYATAAKNAAGLIDGYKIDYQTGFLTQLQDSPIPSGGKNPVAIVITPNNKYLYVLNHDDSDVVLFAIGTDGKIYQQATYNITGSFATAAAIDPAGKFLYVTYTYQNCPSNGSIPGCIPGGELYTQANPGPGGLSVFPINSSDSTLGTPLNFNLGRAPIGITVSANDYIYVISQDAATGTNLFGFSMNSSTGMPSPLPGVTINAGNVASVGYPSGSLPAGVITDASAGHLYVSDQVGNQVIGYSIASNGVPSLIPNGTAQTDASPAGLTIDPSGKYMYVASFTGGAVNGFTFGSNAQPVVSTVAGAVQTGTGPTCVSILGAPSSGSPSHALYMFTSNQLSNTISGNQLNPADGSLISIQGTPFVASTLPTCLVTAVAFPR